MSDFKEFIKIYTHLPEDDWNLIKREFQREVFQLYSYPLDRIKEFETTLKSEII